MSRKRVQWAKGVQGCCSHVATVKAPKDRNPCLTFVATEKKPASRFTKKDDDLRSTQFYLVGHGVQHKHRLVAAISLREGSSLCSTSLKPTMELNSLWQARMMFKKLAKKPYKTRSSPDIDLTLLRIIAPRSCMHDV